MHWKKDEHKDKPACIRNSYERLRARMEELNEEALKKVIGEPIPDVKALTLERLKKIQAYLTSSGDNESKDQARHRYMIESAWRCGIHMTKSTGLVTLNIMP